MAQYIDKDALDTVLRKLWKEDDGLGNTTRYTYNEALQDIQCKIDTLEVKEVDLEIEQRVKECPYRRVECTMYDDHILDCKGACAWVVDYQTIKKLKAQKGK